MSDTQSGHSATLDKLANDVEWIIRPYREEDLPTMVALINAVDDAYKLDEGTGEEDLRISLNSPRSDPARQVVIVEGPQVEGAPQQMPFGFGRVTYDDDEANNARIYYMRVLAHPTAEGRGIEGAIARRLLDIARDHEQDPSMKRMNKAILQSYYREEYIPATELCEALGMKEVRRYWVMVRPLDTPIDEPQSIDGMGIRNYSRPEDNKRALEAFNDSFSDHYDHHDAPQDDWDYWINTPQARPNLSWLAEVEAEPGKIAGFCICGISEEDNKRKGRLEGWIELLGTTRDYRRKGLGRALLVNGLHSLKSAGLDTALLGVDSESLTGANLLYESVGFRIRSRGVQYECALDEVTG